MASRASGADTLSRAEEQALARAKRSVAASGRSRTGSGSRRPAARGTPRRRSGTRGRKADRLAALDLFRGVAVVAGVLVLAGTAPATLPAWARPSPWHGLAAADLVLPAFLVAAGVAMAYADARRSGFPAWRRTGRVLRRTLVLVALGVGLNALATADLTTLRWTGLLQRIALAGLLAWLLTRAPRGWQVAGVVAVLVGWWLVLERLAIPGVGVPVALPAANAARTWDTALVDPVHLAFPTDPLGPTTTVLAAVLVVAGVWLGTWLRTRPTGPATAAAMAVAGGWAVVLGVGWAQVTGLNATLWTPAYVLFTGGACLILLAGVYLATEVLPVGRALRPLHLLGRHPLPAYLLPAAAIAWLSRPDGATSAWARTWEGFLAPVFGDLGGVAAGVGLLACSLWLVATLDRRGWHLRA